MATLQFKPTWIGTLAVIVLCPLFSALGLWQLNRGAEKHTKKEQYAQQIHLPSINVNTLVFSEKLELNWRKAEVYGQYLPNKHVLLDNEILKGKVGYAVYTPFQIANSSHIIWVNRGWTPILGSRNNLPDLTVENTPQRIQGILTLPPVAGLQLSNIVSEHLNAQVLRVQAFDIKYLSDIVSKPGFPYILRLESGQNNRFVQEWLPVGSGEEKHYGYALQWFSFALAVFIIYLVIAIKRVS